MSLIKNYFENIKSRKSSSMLMKIRKMLLFSKLFSVSISFSASIKNHPCYPNKEKSYIIFLFITVIYFPLSIQMNIKTLSNNCYLILTTYMLNSALEHSYNLSINLLSLPWILKLIADMVNDSTPMLLDTRR